MRFKFLFLSIVFFSIFSAFLNPIHAEEKAYIEMFSPQGEVKSVRQISVRFSEQMVPFGDPRLVEPFDISCIEKGQTRWADSRNWIYDFDRDLPAGVICEFTLKSGIKTLSGKEITGNEKFSFSTGGPAIRQSYPYEGATYIDEDQIFILTIDAEAKEESILSNVFCSIEGIKERVGTKIISGEEREKLLRIRGDRYDNMPKVVLQCRQRFPNSSKVQLIWGKGVTSLSGVPTSADQILHFKAREPFTISFTCERENPKANCIPLLPMRLKFSSPISWNIAKNIVMRGANRTYKPEKGTDDEEGEAEKKDAAESFVYGVVFKGTFPENSAFVIELPKEIKDDAGRELVNKDKFPLTVMTDSYPPLAKFAARFGIIELKGEGILPVTLRNLEPEIRSRLLKVDENKEDIIEKAKTGMLEGAVKIGESISSILPDSLKETNKNIVDGLKGRIHKIQADKEGNVIEWLRKVAAAGRERTILKGESNIKEFSVPKPGGAKAFEVVGIPLKEPGLYVVEMESQILGTSLLGEKKSLLGIGEQKPVYVPTAALVTNLSAHFKWGRESSLVWVTSLDKAEPVKGASVTVRDCNGKILWKGKTDADGVAYIKEQLPSESALPHCPVTSDKDNYYDYPQLGALSGIESGLFVFDSTAPPPSYGSGREHHCQSYRTVFING